MTAWKSAKHLLFLFSISFLSAMYTLSLTNHRFYEMKENLKRNAFDTASTLLKKSIGICPQESANKESGLARALLENNCTTEFTRKHVMTVAFDGRTGNILFEMATLIATATRLCYTPAIHRKELPHFDNIFDLFNVKRIDLDKSLFQEVSEPAAGIFDVNLTSRIDPAYNWTLLGFRQSFKYFDNHENLIRSSFKIKEKFRNDVLRYFSSSHKAHVTVGLHVRRGDFVRESSRKLGFSLSTSGYISRAIAYMRNIVGKSRYVFIVVSDDISWCKNNIKGEDIYYSPFSDVGRCLYLLTQCQHNIVTSGSFGWMGAWLNESGVVVYDKSYPPPNTTFGNYVIKEDYYPHHWIGL